MKNLRTRLSYAFYILLAVVFFSCNKTEIQTRIVKNELGYYPQVKHSFFWKRIAKHNTGYGIYSKNDIDYPKSKKECEQIIIDYKEWCLIDKKLVTD